MEIIKKIKNYTINQRHCLGEGSFGKVYEATSEEGRKVAIKKIEQKLINSDRYLKQSLDNEIAIMQKCKHPNIVELYEVIPTHNNIYLVIEYCSGGDLKRFCQTKKITEEIAFNILRQITRGFQELNKYNIIHRDLKPANILIHQDTFKICDFGFAKYFGETGKMARTCVGTPIYMSPQVLKQKQYTSKTDIWSLGILFFELLFGRLPYTGYNEEDLYRNILKGPLQIPQCSKQAMKILQGTLIVEQNSRWGWGQLFENVLNKSNIVQKMRITPKQGGFYRQQNRQQPPQMMQKLPSNNFIVEEDNYQPLSSDRVRQEPFKKQPRNILAVQNGQNQEYNRIIQQQQIPITQQPLLQPIALLQKQPQQNPRFFYFILVQFVVNPIENALSFDSFVFTLWKYTAQLYEKLIDRPQLQNMQVYKNVLIAELNEIRNLQTEMKVKKEGNLRKLGQIVYLQAKNNQSNKKRIVWLKRFLQKKYTYDAID